MERVAFIARLVAIVVSLGYMVLLLPHVAGIGAEHFSSGWFLGAGAVALTWIPLVAFHRHFQRSEGALHLVLSFAPLVLMAAFFGALFAATG